MGPPNRPPPVPPKVAPSPLPRMRTSELKRLELAAETVVWSGLLLGVWVLTLSSVPVGELAIASGAGVVAGVVATLGHRSIGGRWRPSASWLAWLPHLVVAVPRDTLALYRSALSSAVSHGHVTGFELRTLSMPADETTERRAARLALGTLAIAATPGTVVVDDDPDSAELVIHGLTESPSGLERQVGSARVGGGRS